VAVGAEGRVRCRLDPPRPVSRIPAAGRAGRGDARRVAVGGGGGVRWEAVERRIAQVVEGDG
jgi:hypothetical protein